MSDRDIRLNIFMTYHHRHKPVQRIWLKIHSEERVSMYICIQLLEFLIFSLEFFTWKQIFVNTKYFFLIRNIIYSNWSELVLSDETIRIQNFYFSEKLWCKNCWKLPKFVCCRKSNSFQILRSQMKDLNKDCVKISRPYFLYFPRNKVTSLFFVKSVTAGLVHHYKLFS